MRIQYGYSVVYRHEFCNSTLFLGKAVEKWQKACYTRVMAETNLSEQIAQLQAMVDKSKRIVFFGGAGVSTESGIPDFRSEKGVFKSLEKYGHSPEYLVSHSYYMDHTEEFFNY